MAADEEAGERQWRSDMLEVLLRIAGFAEAHAEAQHATLAALAEISGLLVVELQPEDGQAAESVSVADLLENIADDIAEAGQAANLLTVDEEEAAE
jgi:hypothetical protein